MDKTELRKLIKKRAENLGKEYIYNASATIAERLISSRAFKDCNALFIYVSTEKEPDTFHIIENALSFGKKVYVPKCGPNSTMKAIRIHGTDELQPGYMNIPEPIGTEEAEKIELTVIPCISASADGKRLGHGAGYYDRFLPQIYSLKVCLCFEHLMSDEIPMDRYDVYMDIVITENEFIKIDNNS